MKSETDNIRLTKWRTDFADRDMVIKYRSGTANADADAFSRVHYATLPPISQKERRDTVDLLNTSSKGSARRAGDDGYNRQESEVPLEIKGSNKSYAADFSEQSSCFSDTSAPLGQDDPESELLEEITREELVKMQHATSWCANIIGLLGSGRLANAPGALRSKTSKFINDLLYRHVWGELSRQYVLAIPKSLIRDILFKAHDSPESGHLGITKTWKRIKAHFYWPGQYKDVQDYVRVCDADWGIRTDSHFMVSCVPCHQPLAFFRE